MTSTMKIVYACLLIGSLSACSNDKDGSGSGVKPFSSEGSGELQIKSSVSKKSRHWSLSNGAVEGSVFCERLSSGETIISLGEFHVTASGMNKYVPLSGLTLSLASLEDLGEVSPMDIVFNLESSYPSSPTCLVKTKAVDGALTGTLHCVDNVERDQWGWVDIKAKFSCSM